jgi:hypothetical protein
VSTCSNLEGLSHLNFPALIQFTVTHCDSFTTVSDVTLPKLRYLDMSQCATLAPWQLASDSLTLAHTVTLTGCKSLPQGFITAVVEHCKGLRRLEIFGSGEATTGTCCLYVCMCTSTNTTACDCEVCFCARAQ